MLRGLAAGFLGAGLFGMLFGGGLFGGLGGLSSIFGLILQIGLIVLVVRLAMSWWQRRNDPRRPMPAAPTVIGGASSFRTGDRVSAWDRAARRLRSCRADYEAFERLLSDIQDGVVERGHRAGCTRWRRRKWCPISPAIIEANSAAQRRQQGLRHQALAGRSCRSLARRRYRLCHRGDAVLA